GSPIDKVRRRHCHKLPRGKPFPEHHDAIRLGERQRLEKYRVADAENGRIRSDCEGQCQYRCRRECRAAPQRAEGVSEIPGPTIKPRYAALVPNGFHGLCDSTKLEPGEPCRIVRRVAAPSYLLGGKL